MSQATSYNEIQTIRKVLFFSIIISFVILLGGLLISNKAFAAGGIGSGGGASGGSTGGGGYSTRNGWSWAVYDINGGGPSGGFRSGSSWGNVQTICRGANAGSVMIYGIANGAGNIRGYNFTQDPNVPFAGQFSPGTVIDGGRATAVPTSWAQNAFYALPGQGVDTTGYIFGGSGGNVAWFCTGIDPVNHNPVGNSVANCATGFQGWALDADDLNARLGVVIVIKSTLESWNSSNYRISITSNQAIPNPPFNTGALAVFGVSGNLGFTESIPTQFKNASNYDWIVLATNAFGTPSNPLGFSRIGQGTFNCPAEWDVGVDVTCDIDAGTATFSFSKFGTLSGNVTVTRNLRLNNPTEVFLANSVSVYNNNSWPTSPIVVDINAQTDYGQTMDASISVTPGGSGAANNSGNDSRACPTTKPRYAKPYFRVYGSDVVVGKNFVDSSGVCPAGKNPNASINTFSMDRPGIGWVGSGSQFAASATGTITGFMTASMHNNVIDPSAPTDLGVPRPWLGLAFGNNSPPTAGGNDTTGYTGCMPDYEAYVNANASNLFTQPSSATPTVINQTLVNNSNKHVFINGDATITSNITDSATTYNSLDDMNPIIVIVKGNINIAPGVDTLDGLYVAIPKGDGSGGTINTCAVNPITDACINTLTVNGAFAAKKVELNRLDGDANSVTDPNQADSSTNIAEKFIFTPDLFLGLMNRNNINDSTTNQDISTVGDFESLVGLPPVL